MYELDQQSFINNFKYPTLPTEGQLAQTKQARQESMISALRAKRLQKQEAEAQELTQKDVGPNTHWLSALGTLGSVAGGYRQKQDAQQAQGRNDRRLAQSQAAVEQAEAEKAQRQEQFQLAESMRAYSRNEQEAIAAQKKHEELLQQRAADRAQTAATARMNASAQLLGKKPISLVNPTTGERVDISYGFNPENPNEMGHIYVDKDGNEKFSLSFPKLDGYMDPADIETADPMTPATRSSAIFKIDEKLKDFREVQPEFDRVMDITDAYADQGITPGMLNDNVNLAYVVGANIRTTLRNELRAEAEGSHTATETHTKTESIAKSKGWTKTDHGTYYKTFNNDVIVGSDINPKTGEPRRWDRYGTVEEAQDPTKQKSGRKTLGESQSEKYAETWKQEVELEAMEGTETSFEIDPEKLQKAKLSLSEEDSKLAAALSSLLGSITRKVTGLEGSAAVLEQIRQSMGVGEFARMDVLLDSLQKLYYQNYGVALDTIEQFKNVGIQGNQKSVGDQYMEKAEWLKRVRAPKTYEAQGSGREQGEIIDPNHAQKEAIENVLPGTIRSVQKSGPAQPVSAITGMSGNSVLTNAMKKIVDPKQIHNDKLLREGDPVEGRGPLLPRARDAIKKSIDKARQDGTSIQKAAANALEKIIPGMDDKPLDTGAPTKLKKGQPGYAAQRVRLQQQSGVPPITDGAQYVAWVMSVANVTEQAAVLIREAEIRKRAELEKIERNLNRDPKSGRRGDPDMVTRPKVLTNSLPLAPNQVPGLYQ